MGRRLHVRAPLFAAPLLLGLGAVMYLLLQHYSAQAALEAGQRMNLGLARYVVEHQPPGLITSAGQPDKGLVTELAMHVMAINPSLELYLLDAGGRVTAHALDGQQGPDPVGVQVDMAPMRRLLSATDDATVLLPVLGTDPRNPTRANTFSVSSIAPPGGAMGYKDGRANDGACAQQASSRWIRNEPDHSNWVVFFGAFLRGRSQSGKFVASFATALGRQQHGPVFRGLSNDECRIKSRLAFTPEIMRCRF